MLLKGRRKKFRFLVNKRDTRCRLPWTPHHYWTHETSVCPDPRLRSRQQKSTHWDPFSGLERLKVMELDIWNFLYGCKIHQALLNDLTVQIERCVCVMSESSTIGDKMQPLFVQSLIFPLSFTIWVMRIEDSYSCLEGPGFQFFYYSVSGPPTPFQKPNLYDLTKLSLPRGELFSTEYCRGPLRYPCHRRLETRSRPPKTQSFCRVSYGAPLVFSLSMSFLLSLARSRLLSADKELCTAPRPQCDRVVRRGRGKDSGGTDVTSRYLNKKKKLVNPFIYDTHRQIFHFLLVNVRVQSPISSPPDTPLFSALHFYISLQYFQQMYPRLNRSETLVYPTKRKGCTIFRQSFITL